MVRPARRPVETLACPARITTNRPRAAPNSLVEYSAASASWACWRGGDVPRPRRPLWINEMAPRPHNSGHHTIETATPQYGQHLRAILGLPLGDPSPRCPSAMWNLLGEPGCKGLAKVVGLEAALAIPGVHVHVYGKRMTAPFRKMGHVTALGATVQEALDKLAQVREVLKVIA
ncbi:MAG: ATP-grasp domain-containing protein [Kiritimatiellia bacterium]